MTSINKIINFVLPLFIVGLLLSDFITSMAYKFSSISFYRYSGMYKLFFEIIMVALICIRFKKFKLIHKVIITIISCFIIGQYLTFSINYDLIYHFSVGNIYYLNRYLYILIFILFLQSFEIKKTTYLKAYKYLEIILLLNIVLILLAILFNIEIFKSYEYTKRFGYTGLFSKPEEAGFIYAIAIIANYYNWVFKKNPIQLLKLILFLFTILVLGQKKMLLFVFLFFGIHLTFQCKYNKFFRIFLPSLFVLGLFFKTQILNFVLNFSPFWTRIYERNGLLNAITSNRSDLTKQSLAYIKAEWNPLNYIFGGIDFNQYKVEFEFYDLYQFIGLAGLLFYAYLLKYHLLAKADRLKVLLIACLFITSFFSGGLLLSVTATLILHFVSNQIMQPNSY